MHHLNHLQSFLWQDMKHWKFYLMNMMAEIKIVTHDNITLGASFIVNIKNYLWTFEIVNSSKQSELSCCPLQNVAHTTKVKKETWYKMRLCNIDCIAGDKNLSTHAVFCTQKSSHTAVWDQRSSMSNTSFGTLEASQVPKTCFHTTIRKSWCCQQLWIFR